MITNNFIINELKNIQINIYIQDKKMNPHLNYQTFISSEYSSSGSGDRTQKMYLLLSKTSGVCAEDTAPAVCCCAPKRHAVNMEDMFSAISASSESHLKTRSPGT